MSSKGLIAALKERDQLAKRAAEVLENQSVHIVHLEKKVAIAERRERDTARELARANAKIAELLTR